MKTDLDYLIQDLESLIRSWRIVAQESTEYAEKYKNGNYLEHWYKGRTSALNICAELLEKTISGYSETK